VGKKCVTFIYSVTFSKPPTRFEVIPAVLLYALFYIFFANWHSPATPPEVFPCFFLSCKANARVYLVKTRHGPHSSWIVSFYALFVSIVLFYVLFVCEYVLYYCHRVSTQLQLTNISYQVTLRCRTSSSRSLEGTWCFHRRGLAQEVHFFNF
jgi:hypothetical protein